MDKIFTALRHWLASLLEVDAPADPLAQLTLAELADLPAVHPGRE